MVVPRGLHVVNEGLAFLAELAALGFLAWWGWTAVDELAVRILLGLGAPVAAAALWGRYAAPRAVVRLPLPGVLAVKALVFGAGAVALGAVAGVGWGIGFAVFVLLNTALATVDRGALMHRRQEADGPGGPDGQTSSGPVKPGGL
ncbi:YrdB family protein [Kitasatospora mediocidica]|uniref:YrdB family protein n=1 Tax=Kitasatospora mediocidica TaxID=58352 RepID=UPI00068C875A|nr:YrdB family protein [Kitasatospora mediocidica]